jgi:hypothetical protein
LTTLPGDTGVLGRLGDGFLAHAAPHLLDGFVIVLGHPLFGFL